MMNLKWLHDEVAKLEPDGYFRVSVEAMHYRDGGTDVTVSIIVNGEHVFRASTPEEALAKMRAVYLPPQPDVIPEHVTVPGDASDLLVCDPPKYHINLVPGRCVCGEKRA